LGRAPVSAKDEKTPSATAPLGIVYFLLTPQEQERKIPATFPIDSGLGGTDLLVVTGKNRASFHRGEKRAIFAWMDCAMY
jgi:hypothetical protein